MNFSSKITQAVWNEDKARWDIKGEKTLGDGTTQEFMDYCDVLLYCTGILNNWKLPDIEGMDTFRGRIIHTATWPESYGPEQWKNQKVAVIGSGASSLQVVPNMQPEVEHMDVFVRTVCHEYFLFGLERVSQCLGSLVCAFDPWVLRNVRIYPRRNPGFPNRPSKDC